MKTPVNATGYDNWEDVLPHRDDVLLEGIDIFNDYLVVQERQEGLNRIRIVDGSADVYIPFNDPAYTAYVGANPDFNTDRLRYSYASMTTPNSVLEYTFTTGDIETLKQQEVPGGEFDLANYVSERIWWRPATA